jgi:hypothetical protein
MKYRRAAGLGWISAAAGKGQLSRAGFVSLVEPGNDACCAIFSPFFDYSNIFWLLQQLILGGPILF